MFTYHPSDARAAYDPSYSLYSFRVRRDESGKRPDLAAFVGREGRWATTLAGLVPICS